jgi:hypothetical protein
MPQVGISSRIFQILVKYFPFKKLKIIIIKTKVKVATLKNFPRIRCALVGSRRNAFDYWTNNNNKYCLEHIYLVPCQQGSRLFLDIYILITREMY